MPRSRSYSRYYEISDFSGGWNNVAKPGTLKPNQFSTLKNWNITRHRGLEKRGGMAKLYTTTSGATTDVKTLYEYKAPNNNNYILVAVGTKIRAYYNAKWNDLKTGLTTGKNYSFLTHRGLCYGANGLDANFKLRNTTSYAVGIEPPISAPVCAATAVGGTGDLTETHPTAKTDTVGKLRSTASETLLSQSFKLSLAADLSMVTLRMRKVGTPTGGTPAMWVEIHNSQEGTSATKNASDGLVTTSSASDTVHPATGLTTAFADVEFDFSTAEPSLAADTTYYLVVYGDFTVSTTNYVEVGFDNNEPSYDNGHYFALDGSLDWTTEETSIDLVFELYGTATESASQAQYGSLETGEYELIKTSSNYALAQSFQVSAACDVYKVKLALGRSFWDGWTSETIWAEIHSSTTGTSFTKNASTNIVGKATTSAGVEGVRYDFGEWFTLTFDSTKPTLSASTTYYLVLFTDADVSSSYNVAWTADSTGHFVLGTASQTGTGTDDATSGGTYTYATDLDYRVQIDGTGTPDTFKWSDDGGSTWDATVVEMTGEAQTLNNGVTITFGTTTGHTLGDYWDFTATGFAPYTIDSSLNWTAKTDDFSFDIWGAATSGATQESYALTNEKDYAGLRYSTSQQMIAQKFVAPQSGDCTKLVLYLSQVGTIAGGKTVWAEIHDGQDGTSAAQDDSTRLNGTYATAGATPDAISGFPTYDAVTFTFSGTDPTLVEGNTYYIVLYGDYTINTSNYLKVQMDMLEPVYENGNRWDIDDDEDWTECPHTCLTFAIYQADAGLTGNYQHKYTYKRNGFVPMESNPSDPCATVSPSGQGINVIVVASTDAQVDSIVLYRTKAGGTTFYQVAELGSNAAQTYKDTYADTELGVEVEYDNNVPPKAKYLVLHKDRVFYLNCPSEEDGGSLGMWSKSGNGEQAPSLNYQYFDKRDGEDITGGASLGDYLLVFKPNKIGILAGELDAESELWYLSKDIGCISGYAILPFKDKIVFLSQEGFKATDGKNIWDLSTNINGLIGDGYFVNAEEDNYSAVYYPEKEQFQYLSNHSSLDDKIFVGHFLLPLLLESQGASELAMGEIVGWSYHEYDNDELTCLGTYTNSSGITKVIAGASDGFVYELDDSGTDDDGSNIATLLQTDWLTLGTSRGETKTIRKGYITWTADASTSASFVVDIDFTGTDDDSTVANDSTGVNDGDTTAIDLKGTGRLFRFTFTESSSIDLSLSDIIIYFRTQGLR